MFDTMVFTKALGALCGALLIFLLGKWVADSIFVPGSRNLPPAFVVDTGAEEPTDAPVALTFAQAFAAADAAAGSRVWGQCRACHVVDEQRNAVGPYLYNVVGREIGSVEGFSYSGALPAGEVWTPANLYAFVENPRGWAPGTSMSFAGLRSQADRVNLIAFLIQNSPDFDPASLPAEEAAVEEAPAEEAVAEEAASEEAAAEEAVAEEAATEEAPVEEAATEEAVTEEAPVEEAVAAETATEEAPAEEAVAEEAVTEEAPAEEAVAEEAVTEEVPAEEAVAAEAATEEAPAEEVVAAEAATEEAPAEEAVAAEAVTEEAPAEEAVAEAAPAEELSAFAQMVAAGDVAAGQRVWNQCRACHVADATTNRVGPHLGDVVGRQSNSVEGFRYSGRLPDVVWTLDELDLYLTNPRGYAPGTSMAFNGLRSQQDRANVLAYILSLN